MNKIAKRVLIISGVVLGTIVLAAGSYVTYVIASYNRIGDTDLAVNGNAVSAEVKVGETYKAMSYNIGFGAYSQDFTFFLDEGYDDAGNPTCGHWSKARSKEAVEFNTAGAIKTAYDFGGDFYFFQEVDTDSTRSFHINQDNEIKKKFSAFEHVHAVNFHTAFLPYPLYDMHGTVNGGLTTLSRFHLEEAKRKQYTVSTGFSKFFDLDRCFSYAKANVSGSDKYLYVVNSHMSAYDEGGTIRQKQVEELNAFLQTCKDEGAYVVIGGDWNHDLLTNNPDFVDGEGGFKYTRTAKPFGMTKKTPNWVSFFFDDKGKSPLIEGYSVVASDNSPTCRNNDIEWNPGETFVCGVDGFIVSDNIEVVSHQNLITHQGNKGLDGFAYADHEPTTLEFRLK